MTLFVEDVSTRLAETIKHRRFARRQGLDEPWPISSAPKATRCIASRSIEREIPVEIRLQQDLLAALNKPLWLMRIAATRLELYGRPASLVAKIRERGTLFCGRTNDARRSISALEDAIELGRRMLRLQPRDTRSARNRTQFLGTALSELGERESGTARLEEAVAAYRDALEERTRERVPLDWAMTQNNLGSCASAPRRARERHGAARGGRRSLSRRAGGKDPRARAAPMGDDAEQSRQCAFEARRARERHGAARESRRRLSRRARRYSTRSACPTTGNGHRTISTGPGPDCRAASSGGYDVWRMTPPRQTATAGQVCLLHGGADSLVS